MGNFLKDTSIKEISLPRNTVSLPVLVQICISFVYMYILKVFPSFSQVFKYVVFLN